MTDYEGTPLMKGDKVAFIEPRKHYLKKGVVYKVTPRGATVEWGLGFDQGQWTSRDSKQIMLLHN